MPEPDNTRADNFATSGTPRTPREVVRQPPPLPEVYACPICGGNVQEEHGAYRCLRCGGIVEACCEGAPPPDAG